LALALLLPGALHAQDSLSAATPLLAQPDTLARPVDSLGRPIIRYVEIRGSDIFDVHETHSFMSKLMNGLHFTTHPSIIEREVLLHPGEPYDSSRVAETTRNLRALGIFRRVRIDSVQTDSGFILKVYAQDGWSTQADLRFRSTGKQTDWQVALIEKNLLGTATYFANRYRHTPDRSSVNFQLRKTRLIAHSVAVQLRYETRSDGKRGGFGIERPFFSLSDRAGITTVFDVSNERVIQFRDGVGTPSDSSRRQYLKFQVEAAKAIQAGDRGYLRVGLQGHVRREDYSVWPTRSGRRTVTVVVGPFLEWRRANFVVTRGFSRIGRDEDVDVSQFGRIGVTAAPSAFGYSRDGVGLYARLRAGTRMPIGFAWLDLTANGLYTGAGLDSGSASIGATAAIALAPHHLLINHADIGWIKNPQPSTEFDLGFAIGPRAFPIHAFTGDRTYFATSEYRFIFGEDVFKAVDMGIAGFVDYGGAWYHNENRRTGTDVGFGFRLGPSRAADSNPTRLDLAYRFGNGVEKSGWVFVVASGLVFSTQPR
jgi:hypothetical protein